jgi:hypothetical protein
MSSTSFAAALAAGASDCTEQDSELLQPPKSIPGAVPPSALDGASPSVTMFESSPQDGFASTPEPIARSLFADRLPASNIALPTPPAVASMPTTSSSRPFASSASLDLLGQRLRTHLSSELAAMTGLHTSWKQSASPAGRSWWVLPMPAHPIGAQDFGSYAPTPAAQTGAKKGGVEFGGGGSGARKAALVFFPTVTAQDYGSNMGGAAGRTGKKRLSLSSMARSLGLSGRQFLAAIYENMMGFPPGWLSSVAQLTETQSAQSPQNSSDAQS